MRRFSCLFLFLVLTFVCIITLAEAEGGEILFRGIEWHCDIDSAVARITEEVPGRYKIKPDARIMHQAYWSSGYIASSNKAGYSFEITPKPDCYIGGHLIEKITADALYGISDGAIVTDKASSRFVMAEYSFVVNSQNVREVYNDLYSKMCEIYGQPFATSDVLDMYAVWHGANETGVYLAGSTNFLHLCYGKIDSYSDISEILKIRNNELVSDSNSTDGL